MAEADCNSIRSDGPNDVRDRLPERRTGAMFIRWWRRPEVAVGLGAIIGTNLRFLVTTWLGQDVPTTFPSGTLAINLVGSLLIGIAHSLFLLYQALPRTVFLLVSVGFLGGFTTFSTFCLETLELITAARVTDALVYQGVSLVGSIAAVYAGLTIGQHIFRLLRWWSDV